MTDRQETGEGTAAGKRDPGICLPWEEERDMIDFNELAEAMGDLDEDVMMELLGGVTGEDGDAQLAMEACQKGMDIVGNRFEEGEYFVGDLIYAGELMTQAADMLRDKLVSGESAGREKTKMVLCTVKDDLHDIGKNIVRSMLEAAGFEVLDLGIDCPPEKVVEAVKENDIRIVALSGVLTMAIESMKATVDALRAAGLDQVKVIIGGTPVTEAGCRYCGADAWAGSPQVTINTCREWAGSEA